MNKIVKWLLCGGTLGIFIWLMLAVVQNDNFLIDQKVYDFLWKYLNNPNLLFLIKIITNLGGIIVISMLSIFSLVFIKNKKIGIAICGNIGVCCLLNLIVKNIIARPRPNVIHLVEETGFSFPSGHAMASMAFYGLLIYLIYNLVEKKSLKWIYILFFSFLIIAIGLSRIYLGVHYFTDVIAGFMLSFSFLIISTTLIKKYVLKTSS